MALARLLRLVAAALFTTLPLAALAEEGEKAKEEAAKAAKVLQSIFGEDLKRVGASNVVGIRPDTVAMAGSSSAAAEVAWSEAPNGLRVRLTAPSGTVYRRRATLPLLVEVQNVGDKPILFSRSSPQVRNAGWGVRVPPPQRLAGAVADSRGLACGQRRHAEPERRRGDPLVAARRLVLGPAGRES
jgi:hypothetical protein